VVLTVLGSLDGKSVTVAVGAGDEAVAVADADDQVERIGAAVSQGVAEGKKAVLIKAEKKVRLGELFRIANAAAADGVKLHVAVIETEASR
jgi:biopolymer transport protein ExbD